MSTQIVDFKPEYRQYFEKYNKAWLEEFFVVEPLDKYVLENPEEAILKEGGKIYFAEYERKIIGTVALRFVEPGTFELTKMAVGKEWQGIGAGKLLCSAAIEKARALGAKKVMLYTQSGLVAAIGIYHKLGFKNIPLGSGIYKRADIKMELSL